MDHTLLAIVLACKRWHSYLDGKKTIMLTDCKPLVGFHPEPGLNKIKSKWLKSIINNPIQVIKQPWAYGVNPSVFSHSPSCMCGAGKSSKYTLADVPFLLIGLMNHKNARGKPIDLDTIISTVLGEYTNL